jgi:hypothetical protein
MLLQLLAKPEKYDGRFFYDIKSGHISDMRGFQPFLFGLNAVYYLRKV